MRSLAIKLSLCLFAVCLYGCGGDAADPSAVAVGGSVPDFTLTTVDGKTVKGSSLKGEVVILNFWATWCGPCQGEIPQLNQIAATSGAKVVGVALDEDGLKAVKPYLETHPINYTVLIGDSEIFQRFNGVGIPYTLVIDRSQRIVKIYRGPATRESLEADLKVIEQGPRAALGQ
jgi:thiol-disulfide isomerase/thioredoxin